MTRIEVVQGDITKLQVDAIVNAANSTLLGGGGLDGAIHLGAGPELLAECITIGGCPIGEARVTRGYKLPALYIFHAAGPVWRGGHNQEAELLASCYRNCLALADRYQVTSLAFPCISTGTYKFPIEQATRIAIKEVRDFISTHEQPERIVFCCYSKQDYDTYMMLLHEQ